MRGMRTIRAAASAAATCVVACAAVPAGAQPQPDPPAVVRRLPEVVVRDFVPAELPEDPTSFTTVIHADDHRGEVTSVVELLERVAGVQIRRFGGDGQPAEISIRGSTAAQVVVQLDGVRLNSAQSGGVDLSTIPLGLLERIEVSRGGGSVQGGSDAIGGVVNLVTRRPGGPRRTDASVSVGSFDTWRGSLATSGTARSLEYALGYDGFGTEGDFEFRRPSLDLGGVVIDPDPKTAERINNQSVQQAGLVSLGHALGEKLHVSVRDQLFYGSRGQPGLDAGSVGAAGQRENAHERLTRNVLGATLDAADLGGALALGGALDFWHRFERTHFRDPDFVPGVGSAIDTTDRNDEIGARLRFEREVSAWQMRHRGTLMFDARRDLLDSDSFEDRDRDTAGVAVQDDVVFFDERLRLVPALRYDATQGFGGEWLPRIGAIATLLPWLRVKGNVERSYRVPNFDELYFPDRGYLRGNPALQPEEALNMDIGLELGAQQLGPFDDLSFEGAFFHNDVRESIVFLLVSPSLVEPRNTGEATLEGVELSGSFRAFEWLAFSATWTHLDATLDATGAALPGRADDEASFRVELAPPSRVVRLLGQAQLTSEIPVSDSGNTILPDREVFDAALTLDLAQLDLVAARVPVESLLVTFEVKNIGDVAVRDAQFFPQPGRTLALRVETSW